MQINKDLNSKLEATRQLQKYFDNHKIYLVDYTSFSLYIRFEGSNQKWSLPIQSWGFFLNQFTFIFEKRLYIKPKP